MHARSKMHLTVAPNLTSARGWKCYCIESFNLPSDIMPTHFAHFSFQRDSTDNAIMFWTQSKSVLPSQEASVEKCSCATGVACQLTGM